LYFPEENLKQLDQDEIIEILDQAKAMDPEWHEAMVNANTDIFEMTHKESVSYFKRLENLEKIRCINNPNPSSVDKKKSVTSSVDKCSKNHKGSDMWCHYCDKNNHNTADYRAIAKFKQQKNNKACFEAKAGPGKNSLAFLFEEINAIKRQLKPEKTASSKKRTRKAESILFPLY
jgi:hypothetical protein